VPAAAAADRNLAIAVERIELGAPASVAAGRHGEFDNVREVALIHALSDLAFAPAHAGPRLCPGQFAFSRDALMLFARASDAIFEFTAIVRKLLGHFEGPARRIATDCAPKHYGLTDLEFM
jgi:hypothetical protein